MSMIDDLNELPTTYPKVCKFQTIRLEDGEERYAEVVELLAADATHQRKRTVLEQYGYAMCVTTVQNHVAGVCRQCL